MNLKNNQGVTLVALVVTVIIMIILASVTLNVTFSSYQTTKVDKFKAELKVAQDAVAQVNSDYDSWKEKVLLQIKTTWSDNSSGKSITEETDAEKENDSRIVTVDNVKFYLNNLNEVGDNGMLSDIVENSEGDSVSAKAGSEFSTLNMTTYIEKVLVNKSITTENVYDNSNFFKVESNMISVNPTRVTLDGLKSSEKITEDDEESLINEIASKMGKDTLQEFEKNDIKESIEFYDFSNSDDCKYILGVDNIDIPLYIDFENAIVFTTSGIKVDNIISKKDESGNIISSSKSGKIIRFSLYEFSDYNDSSSSVEDSLSEDKTIIAVEILENNGLSQKVKVSLENNDSKVRKIYYRLSDSLVSADAEYSSWLEVNGLAECSYTSDGKGVSFVLYNSGNYQFKIENTNGKSYIPGVEDTKIYLKNNFTTQDGNGCILSENYGYNNVLEGNYFSVMLCNPPNLDSGDSGQMVPIKFVKVSESQSGWVVCSTNDPGWYNMAYGIWPNITFMQDSKLDRLY